MKRREFITLLGGAVLASPLAAHAQQRLPVIGFLGTTTPSAQKQRTDAFMQRLQELGWTDGRTVTIAYRWAEGLNERYAELAAEFVRLKADVIVTAGIAVPALMKATSTIPIVFALDNDPVGRGLVASLARPGGNVTGLSSQVGDLAGKQLALLREVLPNLQRLAIMANVGFPGTVKEMEEVEAAARTLGLAVVRSEIRKPEDIEPAFHALKGRADALFVVGEALVVAHRVQINTLALAARLPSFRSNRDNLDGGGLMSYGPDTVAMHRRAGDYVDKILRGAKPADLPVEQPTKFELIINLKTATSLGIEIPSRLLFTADEVIE